MTLKHLEKISENLTKDFDDFWNINIFKTELLNENSHYIVLEKNEEIIGFGGFWRNIDEAHITNIVVRKDLRKQGYASIILQNLLLTTYNLQLTTTLEVSENNTAAINLYKKFNFQIVGERKGYYNGQNNAIIMTLSEKGRIFLRQKLNKK